jgi:two-component system phosphate regulon response regulator PhoB
MDGHRKPRILVVEDHPHIADIVQTRLRLDGMDPVLCANGIDAIARVGAEPFDAVVLDVMMPVVDGYEVLRHIRATPEIAALPVILLTAKARPEDVERGLAMGADEYITKPFGPHDLVRTLRKCLSQRRGVSLAESPHA